MKKTGSETPADDSENSKAAPAEPVERTRLQADVAKQRVRIAKEELKRARKRLKEAKREARRARKQASAARKAWKQERRTAANTAEAIAKNAMVRPRKKKKEAGKSARIEKAVAENSARKSAPAKRKKTAPVAKRQPAETNAVQTAHTSPKRGAALRAKRATKKERNTKVREQPMLASVETEKNLTVPVTAAANSEEVGAPESAAGDRAGSEGIPSAGKGTAVDHGT
jgi:colicin import membrane protein